MAQRTCSIDGCEREHYARTWCNVHWRRWRKHGDPRSRGQDTARDYFQTNVMSEVDGCKLWPFTISTVGYGTVNLRPSQTSSVHVLACEAWHGPRPDGMVAAHGPCHDRSCWNGAHLSWKTPGDNARDRLRDGTNMPGSQHPMAKLTEEAVMLIRSRRGAGETGRSLALEFGVTPACISQIVLRRHWQHV